MGVILIFGVRAYGGMDLGGMGSVMSMIISIIAGVILPIGLGIYSMVFAIMQVRLNRKAIGVVSIIVATITLLSGVAMVALIFVM